MEKWLRLLSSPLLIVGAAASLYASTAIASTPDSVADWRTLFVLVIGVLSTGTAAYLKGVNTAVQNNAQAIVSLRELLLTKYHDSDEIKDLIAPVRGQLDRHGDLLRSMERQLLSLHTRLDIAGVSPPREAVHVHTRYQDDGN